MSLATEAQSFGLLDPKLCYLLDGILFIYGVIVTALYLRAKVGSPGLLWGNVGSSIGRMPDGALALESLQSGLRLVCMGKAGDGQVCTVGGLSPGGRQGRCIGEEGLYECLDMRVSQGICWPMGDLCQVVKDKKVDEVSSWGLLLSC